MIHEEDLPEVDASDVFNEVYCRPASPMLLCYLRESGAVFSEFYREDAQVPSHPKTAFLLLRICLWERGVLSFRNASRCKL